MLKNGLTQRGRMDLLAGGETSISSSPEDERRVKGLGTESLVDSCDIRTGVGVPVGTLCVSWLRSEDFIA